MNYKSIQRATSGSVSPVSTATAVVYLGITPALHLFLCNEIKLFEIILFE